MRKTAAQEHREKIKDEFWPKEVAWTGEKPEQGWFRAPRTLPLILILLRSEKTTDSKLDPTGVYLELLARHRDTGIVEMVAEGEHSYSAGYAGSRGVRSWQERMQLLAQLGFIKSKRSGNQQYKYVLLVHPTIVVRNLHDAGKIDPLWWDTYTQRQIETKQLSYDAIIEAEEEKSAPDKKARPKTKKRRRTSSRPAA